MLLKDAINAAWERARERCRACRMAAREAAGRERYGYGVGHTCYGDIEAVKDVALAAGWYMVDHTYKQTEAETERLLEVKHE